jgi:hypothetical protein
MMAFIGISGSEGFWSWSLLGSAAKYPEADAYGKGTDGCSDHGSWGSESPMGIWGLQVVQLVQENGGLKFTIVPVPAFLYCLEDCLLVPVMKQVHDFANAVHGLDLDLHGFRFGSRDHMVHGAYKASRLDLDCVT